MTKDIKRAKEIESVLNTECPKYEKDCSKCPHKELCDEYSHLELPKDYFRK